MTDLSEFTEVQVRHRRLIERFIADGESPGEAAALLAVEVARAAAKSPFRHSLCVLLPLDVAFVIVSSIRLGAAD
jgi:hypothetical protein